MYQERGEAFEYRKKFYPGAGPTSEQAGITDPVAVFTSAFNGGYGGGAGAAPTNSFSQNYGMGAGNLGGAPGTLNQGFGSDTAGQFASGAGGPGLGSAS